MRKSLFVYGYLEKGINHMEILSMQFLMALGTIVLMDLLLGGDNAVVIAMAANKLPENLRKTLPDIDKLQNLLSENDSKSETVR